MEIEKFIDYNLGDFNIFRDKIYTNIKTDSYNLKGNQKYKSWKELGNLKRVERNLDLAHSRIETLDDLEYVGGNLYCLGSDIKSLGKLKYIGGHLILSGSDIETLGELEHVDSFLGLIYTPNLKDLGNLKYVGGKIYYDEGSAVEALLKERGLI
jgi:hypothetical protein